MGSGQIRSFAALLAAAGCLFPGQSAAQQALQRPDPFSTLVGETRLRDADAGPRVQRFVTSSEDRFFLLQTSGDEARLKFLCADGDDRIECLIDSDMPGEEAIFAHQTRGPRGDTLYRDASGATRLRLSAYGGATVFWPGEERGVAAYATFSDEKPMALAPVGHAVAAERARRATAIVSAKVGAPIEFDAGDEVEPGAAAPVLADAILRAASGVAAVAADETGAKVLGERLRTVGFRAGRPPAVRLDGSALTIIYDPEAGIEGRPSSVDIASYLEESL